VDYRTERPQALKPPVLDTDGDDPDVHVLKLTHNPVWDNINLGPVWHDLDEAMKEHGFGYPEFKFMASYKKPVAMGDQLNVHNSDTLERYHKRSASNV
jgi:hypothetical protein